MTMQELSTQYATEALAIQQRLTLLRQQARQAHDPDARAQADRRIRALQPLLTQARTLTLVTGRYYERGYRRHGEYSL